MILNPVRIILMHRMPRLLVAAAIGAMVLSGVKAAEEALKLFQTRKAECAE